MSSTLRPSVRASLLAIATLSPTACIPLDPGGGGGIDPPVAFGPAPQFGQTVSLDKAPPPLSGGTLLEVGDGSTVVAADPDRDRVVVVDVAARQVRATLALQAGDEPGRAVSDGLGRVHVVLRGGGAVADVDPTAGKLLGRRAACPAPRGIAYRAAKDDLVVACAGGELMSLPATGGAATRLATLDRDLRDVVVDRDGTLMVSRLRTAEVLVLGADGQVSSRVRPPMLDGGRGTNIPNTAWRATAVPGGGVIMTHQRSSAQPVQITPGGYGGGSFECDSGSIVASSLSVVRSDTFGNRFISTAPMLAGVVLPVDVAVNGSDHKVAVVAAGNAYVPGASQVFVTSVESVVQPGNTCEFGSARAEVKGEAIAAAWLDNALVVQTREPSTLQIVIDRVGNPSSVVIPLGGETRFDTGFAVFHSNSGAGLACASCHAEGGDDGRTWNFADLGPRRTQSLRGGISARAPYHWSADEKDFGQLISDVFVGRMSGPQLDGPQAGALLHWVDRIPALPAPSTLDSSAVARGRLLFHDAAVGCATCHAGPLYTDNRVSDVGTDGSFKTPTLVNVAARAPFLHDGCAATLRDRFVGVCGGGDKHGKTSNLGNEQLKDLVAYLESL